MADELSDLSLMIASRLREARQKKYASAAAAARALGMNEVTLRAHESGQNGIPIDVMMTYCKAYGMDMNWLIRGHRVVQLEVDPRSGVILDVDGALADGIYLDPAVAKPAEAPLAFPSTSGYFGIETYLVQTSAWEPTVPKGSYVVCTPADAIALRVGERVVAQQNRAGLIELTLKALYLDDSGEAYLVEMDGGTNRSYLTGPQADPNFMIRSVVKQVVYDLERPPLDETIRLKLPIVARAPEPL